MYLLDWTHDIEVWKIIIPSLTLLSTSFIAYAVERRNAYIRVQEIIKEVTTGEIAEHRHKLASYFIHNCSKDAKNIATPIKSRKPKVSKSDATDSAFRIIWALVQVFAVKDSLAPWSILMPGPKKLLINSLNSFVEWHLGTECGKIKKFGLSQDAVLVIINRELDLRSGDLDKLIEKTKDWKIKDNEA